MQLLLINNLEHGRVGLTQLLHLLFDLLEGMLLLGVEHLVLLFEIFDAIIYRYFERSVDLGSVQVEQILQLLVLDLEVDGLINLFLAFLYNPFELLWIQAQTTHLELFLQHLVFDLELAHFRFELLVFYQEPLVLICGGLEVLGDITG